MCGCPADDNEPTAATNEKCEECGIALPAGATACPNCGCPVSAGKAAMQGAAPPPPNYSAIQPEKKKSNKQTIIIIAIVAAVILLGGIGAFIALNGNSSEQPSSVTEEYDYVETPVEVEIAEPVVTQKFVVVNGTNVRLRYAPSFDSDWLKWYDGTIRCADKGDELPYVSETNEWYGVIYQNGNYYIHKDFSYVVER